MEPIEKNNNYPIFEVNQVLSSTHLNQIFNYLDEQERLTRADLIGIGIVCGLKVALDVTASSATIRISRGCGITSEGYLLVEPVDVSLVSYRNYTLPTELAYPKFKNQAVQFKELFPAGEPGTTPLTQGFLSDKAVLLFIELKKEGLRNCSPNNCDDRGASVTATVRRLLVPTDDLKKISDSPFVGFQKLAVLMPEIPLPRIHFSTPENLHNYQNMYKDFFVKQINGKTVLVRLSDAIDQAGEVLKKLLPDLVGFDKAKLLSIFNFPANTDVSAIQYHYDLLRDLTSAYHELRAALLKQPAICMPDSEFPQHLTLGALASSNPAEWRTAYYPSPAVASAQPKLGELRFLFDRLNQLVLNFNVQSGAAVALKITPSLYGFKQLSGKSLPCYYKPELREHWDATRRGEQAREILSWHDDASSPDHVRNPLQYDLEPYNFFRVEGIIGKNIVDVATDLGVRLKTNRLPFAILHVNADKVGNFLEKHYAMDHEAGALRGGTLVVVHNENGPNANLVSADFALPYRIEKDGSGCLGRVMVKECDFEWFDSRKHISNLARREYRFPPRPAVKGNSQQKESQEFDKALLAEYYVILVYRYDIQGKTLIGNSPVQVRVPIAELVKGHLSVIARKLNETFPGGLVFDHKPNSNKIHIRYFNDHTFRIEWGGLQGNQIRYAYSPDGICRWQKGSWELLDHLPNFKVQCRLRNEYRADEYQWLQEDDYFDADYPSTVPLPTADELIRWQKMIKMRAPAVIDDLPISRILGRIRRVIDESYNVGAPQVTAILVGSWANGSWYCRDLSKNKFPAGFLELRRKVTGKSGPSDIDLLVEITDDNITTQTLLDALCDDSVIENSGYAINILFGKKDAQRGLALN